MHSMTGFGRGEAVHQGLAIIAQVSSVNAKRNEVRLSLPRELNCAEPAIRKRVGQRIARGVLRVGIEFDGRDAGARNVKADLPLARGYVGELERLNRELGLDQQVLLRDLLLVPDLFAVAGPDLGQAELEALVLEALDAALDALIAMRGEEGEALARDLEERCQLLAGMVDKIAAWAPDLPAQYRQRLLERIERLAADVALDNDRLMQEVALFADRCDVSEEITRLRSHLEQMKAIFAADGSVGRKLDFLIQEVFREINTIGSKVNHLDTAHCVVDFKTELERIREQAQNVE